MKEDIFKNIRKVVTGRHTTMQLIFNYESGIVELVKRAPLGEEQIVPKGSHIISDLHLKSVMF